jgi:hypothetical protein
MPKHYFSAKLADWLTSLFASIDLVSVGLVFALSILSLVTHV